MSGLYYPCMMDWEASTISKLVGPAMSHSDAVAHLKQHYSGAWEKALACPQPVEHEFFANLRED